ncbi:DUF1254 domain-containing protein [Catellatospora bangladeshensis]|uniref:DUF1254 domain-containing protein n=1 Tax=Catellatospora bangladeshensis TaxID=310355 RepID=UPI003623B8A7
MRAGLRNIGVTSARQIAITGPRPESASLYLTPDTDTAFAHTFLDLNRDGPTVVEAPPNSRCVVDDFWFRHVTDLGLAGPDEGRGGKYLFLPPDHEGEFPDGYYVFRCPTYTNWAVFRALDGADTIRQVRVHPSTRPPTRRPTSSSTSPGGRTTPCSPATRPSTSRSTPWCRRSRSTRSIPSGAACWPPSASSRTTCSPPTTGCGRSSAGRRRWPRAWRGRWRSGRAPPRRTTFPVPPGSGCSTAAATSSCTPVPGCSTPARPSTTWPP